MYKRLSVICKIIDVILIFFMANICALRCFVTGKWFIPLIISAFILVNIRPDYTNRRLLSKKLKRCADGLALLEVFLASAVCSVLFFILGIKGCFDFADGLWTTRLWVFNSLTAFFIEAAVFWNGIIRVYIFSEQLGIKWRVIGIVCGLIPVAHLYVLGKIIYIVSKEITVENERMLRYKNRGDKKVCATKYPLLMVHGVFFRDYKYLNYWGRIPAELELNGAEIYYGNHQSAASVEYSGREIADRIFQIVKETGCEKVNLIAHSKGGLDCRMALTLPGVEEHVASLTTINTPHRGCRFADYLLNKIPKQKQQIIAATYNSALKKCGDTNPDFLAAVNNLTADYCKKFNEDIKDVPGVYYQSIGSKMNHPKSGRFPLNFSYRFVDCFEYENDGLVGAESFPWSENYQYITVKGRRGVSHGDMIDLNRENIPGFDVREFYVNLVSGLKAKGF